jgi:hypothetical protein
MTVSELIVFLETQPQHLTVVYRVCSEQCVMDPSDIVVGPLCPPRPDGWVHNYRPDRTSQDFLIFPGN